MGVKLEEISASYADRFIPRPSLEDVVKGALGFSRESLGYNAKFVYPREGGISALPKALAASLSIPPRYQTSVERVDLQARVATLSDGEQVRFRRLVNTMALPHFIALLTTVPGEVRAARLHPGCVPRPFTISTSGFRGPGRLSGEPASLDLFPAEFIFYRASSHIPRSMRRPRPPVAGATRGNVRRCAGLAATAGGIEATRVGGFEEGPRVGGAGWKILFMELCNIPYAYVVFDDHYERSRGHILDWLARRRTTSAGRWGGWRMRRHGGRDARRQSGGGGHRRHSRKPIANMNPPRFDPEV